MSPNKAMQLPLLAETSTGRSHLNAPSGMLRFILAREYLVGHDEHIIKGRQAKMFTDKVAGRVVLI